MVIGGKKKTICLDRENIIYKKSHIVKKKKKTQGEVGKQSVQNFSQKSIL